MLIKQNIKATLESFHEDLRIENKLEKKVSSKFKNGIHVGFTTFIYTKKPTNNYSLQGW
jgi:hypothetical protein